MNQSSIFSITYLRRNPWTVSATLLICVGFFLRAMFLESYPLAMNQDELSNTYDAWSIAQTGHDRFDSPQPFVLRGFGNSDYRPALYAWLDAGIIKVSGFSVAAGRAISVLFGSLSLLLLYLTVLRWSGKPQFALLALLFAALQPWHLLFSRLAHEGAIMPAFFTIFSLFLWQKMIQRNLAWPWVLALGFCLGISINEYHSLKVSSLLLAVGVAGYLWWNATDRRTSLGVFGAALFLGAWPQIWVLWTDPVHFFARVNDVSNHSIGLWHGLVNLVSNAGSNMSPSFLLTTEGQPNNLSPGRLLALEAILVYPGFIFVWRQLSARALPRWVLALAVVAVVLPAALANPNPQSLRSSALCILLPIFSAATLMTILEYSPLLKWRKILLTVFIGLIACNGLITIQGYARNVSLQNDGQQHFLVLVGQKMAELRTKYARVIVEPYGNQPYIYYAAFSGMSPLEFQKTQKKYSENGWDQFYTMGNIHWADARVMANFALDPHNIGQVVFLCETRIPFTKVIDSVSWQHERFYIQTPQGNPAQATDSLHERIDPAQLQGKQDYGLLGMNGPVNQSGEGFLVAGQNFTYGFGVHGTSHYAYTLSHSADSLLFDVGLSDDATCGGGVRFRVTDGTYALFVSDTIHYGRVEHYGIAIKGLSQLAFETDSLTDNRCDHANWMNVTLLRH